MSEIGVALSEHMSTQGALYAMLFLACVLRERRKPLSSVVWPCCVFALLECGRLLGGCQGQGRLVDPPSRASMWRYDFSNPVDFKDDRVDCGGFVRQWKKNRGRCGVCGDPWDVPVPRPHETKGRYGRGIIVRNYTQAQAVMMEVEVTAPRSGHFEYQLCPRRSVWIAETHDCFAHALKDDLGRSQIPVNVSDKFARLGQVLHLPQGVSCLACVLQWKFVTVGSEGRAEYRACADVTITPAATAKGDNDVPTTTTTNSSTTATAVTTTFIITEQHKPLSTTTALVSSRIIPDTTSPHAIKLGHPHETDGPRAALEKSQISAPPTHTLPYDGMQSDSSDPEVTGGGNASGDVGNSVYTSLPGVLNYMGTLLVIFHNCLQVFSVSV